MQFWCRASGRIHWGRTNDFDSAVVPGVFIHLSFMTTQILLAANLGISQVII